MSKRRHDALTLCEPKFKTENLNVLREAKLGSATAFFHSVNTTTLANRQMTLANRQMTSGAEPGSKVSAKGVWAVSVGVALAGIGTAIWLERGWRRERAEERATKVHLLSAPPHVITAMAPVLRRRLPPYQTKVLVSIMSVVGTATGVDAIASGGTRDLLGALDAFNGSTHIIVFYSTERGRDNFVKLTMERHPYVTIDDVGRGTDKMGFRRSGPDGVEFFSTVHHYVALVPLAAPRDFGIEEDVIEENLSSRPFGLLAESSWRGEATDRDSQEPLSDSTTSASVTRQRLPTRTVQPKCTEPERLPTQKELDAANSGF